MQEAGAESTAATKPDGAVPLRKETFLARYSRNLKLSALALIFFIVASPFIFGGHSSPLTAEKKPPKPVSVQGMDSKAAIPNPQLTKIEAAPSTEPVNTQNFNEQDDHTIKLAPVPDGGLSEDTAEGTLPRIGADGRQPWQVYARPFNSSDPRPRIAIVVADLGLSRIETDAAISRLPTNVTLAFNAQSRVAGAWCSRARQDGHETLLMVPMEPFDYPRSDPGPNTLLTSLPNTDNLMRLQWALRQAAGYVGITTLSGSRFTTSPEKLETVLDTLKQRGLMILDARIAPHSAVADLCRERKIPVAVATEQLDQNLSPDAIDAALNQLEQTAHLTGRAIGITSAEPIMVDRLQIWLKQLPARGIALAPISAMTK